MKIWIYTLIVCSVFLADMSLAQTTASKFVQKRVKLIGCSFEQTLIIEALTKGLSRISSANPTLGGRIQQDAFQKKLTIYCDIGPAPAAINYRPEDDSVHLRITSPANSNTMANFFHEFLHFYGLDHVEDPRIVSDFDDFIYDPVYACHLTAFPDLAERLGASSSIVDAATEKCANVKPVNQDLRGFKY